MKHTKRKMEIDEAVRIWLGHKADDDLDEAKAMKVYEAKKTIKQALRDGYKLVPAKKAERELEYDDFDRSGYEWR